MRFLKADYPRRYPLASAPMDDHADGGLASMGGRAVSARRPTISCVRSRRNPVQLVISFVQRRGRRQLLNLQELVTACNGWQPQLATCRIVRFVRWAEDSAAHAPDDRCTRLASWRRCDQRACAARPRVSGRNLAGAHEVAALASFFIKLFNSNAKNEDGEYSTIRLKPRIARIPHKVAKTFHAHLELSWAVLPAHPGRHRRHLRKHHSLLNDDS